MNGYLTKEQFYTTLKDLGFSVDEATNRAACNASTYQEMQAEWRRTDPCLILTERTAIIVTNGDFLYKAQYEPTKHQVYMPNLGYMHYWLSDWMWTVLPAKNSASATTLSEFDKGYLAGFRGDGYYPTSVSYIEGYNSGVLAAKRIRNVADDR